MRPKMILYHLAPRELPNIFCIQKGEGAPSYDLKKKKKALTGMPQLLACHPVH